MVDRAPELCELHALRALRTDVVARLRAAGCVFAEEEADILLEHTAGDAELLEELASQRAAGAPLEPLVGWVDFGGLRLAVGPGVFVPRQRTLALAERAAAQVEACFRPGGTAPVVVEAFAGVAPVAAYLQAACPEAEVYACELDAVARKHATANLRLGAVLEADVLDGLPEDLRGRVDIIAAVPPYVPDGELELLPREAREHEPLAALTAGVDGMRWIAALIEQATAWLAPGGVLLIELAGDQEPIAARLGERIGLTAARNELIDLDDSEELTTVVLGLRRGCSPVLG